MTRLFRIAPSLVAGGLVATLLLAAVGARAAPTGHSSAAGPQRPTNINGAGLVDSLGRPVNFDRESLASQVGSAPRRASDQETAGSRVQVGAGTGNGLFEETYRDTVFGSGIGAAGLIAVDLDDDGDIEIIANGTTSTFGAPSFWYVLEHEAASGEYQMRWSSGQGSQLRHIAVHETPEGKLKIYVGRDDNSIAIYDGATLTLDDTLSVPASIVRMAFGDPDNDGETELAVLSSFELYVVDLVDHGVEHTLAFGGSDFEIANVDADAANEIVIADGWVLEFDGTTVTTQWNYTLTSFGALVDTGDIDGDGIREIIGASAWDFVTSFDADLNSPKWQIPTDLDVDALLVADVTGDGQPEVLYGDGQWGNVYAHDGATGGLLWPVDNPEHGVTNILVADTDNDGELELVWGSGWTSSGEDHLYVHSVPTLAREWESVHLDGPFMAMAIGDADGDGEKEIVYCSFESNSGYDDPVMTVVDATTYAIEWRSPENFFGGAVWHGATDLEIGDADNDGSPEVVIASSRTHDGKIFVVDVVSKTLEGDYLYDSGALMHTVALADVDNDGQMEIVAGADREHTGAPGTYVYVIDGATGVVEWNSISIGSFWTPTEALEIADVDGDSTPEIVAVNDLLYVIDGITHQQWQSLDVGYRSVTLADVEGDSRPEILAGRDDGQLQIRDGATYAISDSRPLCAGAITAVDAIPAGPMTADGSARVVVACDDALRLYDVGADAVLWDSGSLGTSVARSDSVKTARVGQATRLMSGSATSVFVFESNSDMDASLDSADNCINAANDAQVDADSDGFGNACDADFTNDCLVNFGDLGYLKSVFMTDDAVADLTGDGTVNFGDLAAFKALFMSPPGPSGPVGDCVAGG